MSIRVSGLLGADPEATFAVVSDLEQDPLWRETVQRVDLLSGEAGALGATYRAVVDVMGGDVEIEIKLDSLDPPRQVRYLLIRPMRANVTYTVEPEGTGVRVTFELDLSISGGMAAVRERVINGFISQGAERDLRSLDALLTSRRDDP